MSALRELLASFSIEVDDEKLENLGVKIERAKHKLVEFGEVLLGGALIEGAREFLEGQVQAAAQLKITSERLGVAVGDLQEFQFAAQLSGASAEDAATGLRFLNKNVGDAVTNGGEAATTFAKLHIQLKNSDGSVRNITDITADLADRLKDTKSQAERTNIAMKLLGRGGAALLPLFQEGAEGIEKANAAFEEMGGGIDEEFIENAHKAEQQTLKLSLGIQKLKTMLATVLLPVFVWIVDKIKIFVIWIEKLGKTSNVFKTLTLFVVGLGVAIGAVSAAGLLAELLEFAIPAAIILGLYLIFDDIYTLITGGDSVLGRLLDRMFGVGASKKFVDDLKTGWVLLTTAVSWLADNVLPIIVILFQIIGTVGEAVFESVLYIVVAVVDALTGLIQTLAAVPDGFDAVKSAAGQMAKDVGKDLGNALHAIGFDALVGVDTGTDPNAGKVSAPVVHRPAADVPAPGAQGQSVGTQKIEVNNQFHGKMPDAKEAAKLIGDTVKKATENRNAFGAVGTGM